MQKRNGSKKTLLTATHPSCHMGRKGIWLSRMRKWFNYVWARPSEGAQRRTQIVWWIPSMFAVPTFLVQIGVSWQVRGKPDAGMVYVQEWILTGQMHIPPTRCTAVQVLYQVHEKASAWTLHVQYFPLPEQTAARPLYSASILYANNIVMGKYTVECYCEACELSRTYTLLKPMTSEP